jgi:diguanylate cyclase (GGDEF)-like protein
MYQISLRQLTARYTLIVLAIVIALSVVSFLVFKSYLEDLRFDEQVISLEIKAKSISRLVNFYRHTIRQIASQQKVRDLILFAENSEAEIWATSMQKLLPESIGLALFDYEGNVLGNPMTLNLSKMCIADLHKHIFAEQQLNPPIHRRIESYAHFDIVESVVDEDEIIGVLFSSFSLQVVQNELNRIIEKGQRLSVVTKDRQLIARAGNLNSDKFLLQKNLPVPDTDWQLIAVVEEQNMDNIFLSIAMTNVALFLLISSVFYVFALRLTQTFEKDFKAIRELLDAVKKDHKSSGGDVHSRLLETDSIVQDIQHIADDIGRYQKKLVDFSVTDDLTGLYNRRALHQEMKRCIELPRRDIEVVLIALDVDHLKRANDHFGHAVGDQVLQQLASVLKNHTRGVDICVRMGGDEFVVVLINCDTDKIAVWYENIKSAFQKNQMDILDASEDAHLCSLSAGYTVISKEDCDVNEIVKRADLALYQAKGRGRGNIQSYLDII